MPEAEVELEDGEEVTPEGRTDGCSGLLLTQAVAAAAATWNMLRAAAERSTGAVGGGAETALDVAVAVMVEASIEALPPVWDCKTAPFPPLIN